MSFVGHYSCRDDDALPIVVAIATLPIVLPNGELLHKHGLDRDRGIVFRVPPELVDLLPKREDCTPEAIVEAMRFLTEEWLCDVATDYAGKCTIIADVLTIIERSLLPDRPAFWVTAGRRGGGKTTVIIMLVRAATGFSPPAAAWSMNEEERRKALLSYLMEGLACVVWDNIPRNARISCPHIEKSCTAEFYADRKLGVSETVATSAACVHQFTGNNCGPRGDLASRSLMIRINVDRPDPENRTFRHPDPIGWTDAHRGQILAALYTVLLGNPLFGGKGRPPETRFKVWWALIGQAIEHAASLHAKAHAERETKWLDDDGDYPCPPKEVSFKDMFLERDQDDEDAASLLDVLRTLLSIFSRTEPGSDRTVAFRAVNIVRIIEDGTKENASETAKERSDTLRSFLVPKSAVSTKAVTRNLKGHVDEPVSNGNEVLTLKTQQDSHLKITEFFVVVRPNGA
jgi:hypothetical protein